MPRTRTLASLAVSLLVLSVPLTWGQSTTSKQQADSKAIAALIEQLGSAEYKQRETATRSLAGIGKPALTALRDAADKHADAEVRRRAKGLVEKIENSLEQLLEDYRSYGLPLPTKDTPFVRIGSRSTVNGVEQPLNYSFGFLLKPGSKTEPPDILWGIFCYPLDGNQTVTQLDPTKATAKDIDGWTANSRDEFFFLAIQCKARGWDVLARTFFNRRSKESETRKPLAKLRSDAWFYWESELKEPGTSWPTAAKQMHALIRDDPELDTLPNKALLKSLDLALVPSKAKPGSTEALIDALIDATSTNPWSQEKADAPCGRLAGMGFDVVPALIEHLDDDRLTRYRRPGFNNFPGYQCRIGHMAGDLLEGLAGEDLGKDHLVGKLAQKEKAREWWERARKVGEEAYVLAHVLPKDRERPNSDLLWLLLKKYPPHLPKIYRTMLDDRPQLESGLVAHAIARSELPPQRKVESLIYGARHENRHHRKDALDAIASLDHELFVETLAKMLDELPRTPKETYWHCPEQEVVSLVLRTEDARVWKALEKNARRVDVGLRMQLLRRVANNGDENQRRPERFAFLRSFLDDATLRDMKTDPDRYVAVPAGDDFPLLEVRNYAALEIARLLKLDRKPLPSWDDEQWKRLRDEVREALKR